jgi:hypothetical protein
VGEQAGREVTGGLGTFEEELGNADSQYRSGTKALSGALTSYSSFAMVAVGRR